MNTIAPDHVPQPSRRARRVAFDVIHAVNVSDAYANLLLPARIGRGGLHSTDATFATELTYGTLRKRGFYDRVIQHAAARPISSIDPVACDILRLGAHQLLSTRVPPHAAVNETVSLARIYGAKAAVGFCNAVLRSIERRSLEKWQTLLTKGASRDDEKLAIRFAHPEWVVTALRDALTANGRDGELEALLAADNKPARVNLVALPGLVARDRIAREALIDPRDNAYSPFGLSIGGGDPGDLHEVRVGHVRVQDEASQIAAVSLSRARPIRPGENWIDFCAGPGGKAALLAAEARAAGANFVANEIVPARAGLVRKALTPFAKVEVWETDATEIGHNHPEAFDRILLDAPCTGLGALRRRPEARWRKVPNDVAELAALQNRLVDSAVRALKPDGVLVYVTCSPHVAETHDIVRGAFERWGEHLELLDSSRVLGGVTDAPLQLTGGRGAAQLWPHAHNTDALFIAMVVKARSIDDSEVKLV